MEYETKKQPETLQAAMDSAAKGYRLAVESTFVPWSESRNKDQKDDRGNPVMSLNWRVRLVKAYSGMQPSKLILETDYMAGIAHCPSYERLKSPFGGMTKYEHESIVFEVENGREATKRPEVFGVRAAHPIKSISPSATDVMHSLLMDAGAIDYPSYEEWASNFGYEEDSRKGEAIYRACLEIGLKLRSALGDEVLRALQEAAQDY